MKRRSLLDPTPAEEELRKDEFAELDRIADEADNPEDEEDEDGNRTGPDRIEENP